MRRILILVVLVSLGFWSLGFAEPYAKKVKITSSTSPVGQMFIANSKVPDASEVSIPPYPGALILQTRGAGEMQVNGKDALPYVKLLTPEDIGKVVAWYQEQLASFYFEEVDLGAPIYRFWEKKGNYAPFDFDALMMNVNVVIADGKIHQDDYPKAKTMIEITYRSQK